MWRESHLSDSQLLLDLDGEMAARASKKLRAHLAACWKCRARRQELEQTIADFVRVQEREGAGPLPPAAGPRALLKARLAQMPSRENGALSVWLWTSVLAAGTVLLVVIAIAGRPPAPRHARLDAIPDSRLTPGAALLASRESVCAQPNTKNRAVPIALRRKVFEAYGISEAEPRNYEVDYLITPALGGADDIHNLWPQPYGDTVWNAEVKDELEDRLRELVCEGDVDLSQAQREIAANWIAAYKKYFHTDRPLGGHYK
jgi:hypothetical protein